MKVTTEGGRSSASPRTLERTVTLRDGAPVGIRPILPEDEARLVTLYSRLSPATAYQRFLTLMPRLPESWARYFANVDYRWRMALVAERDLDWRPELIGVARYEASPGEDTAEVAIVVQDYWQGKGLGTILLTEILRAGEANGLRRFRAHVLADNQRMLALLARLTDVQERTTKQRVVTLRFARRHARPDTPTPG